MPSKKKETRPKKSTPLTKTEQRINEDHNWALSDKNVRKKYGGLVVAVYKRKVWGAGKNHREASKTALAKPHCPGENQLSYVVIPR